ncbi:NAD(P)H-dependent glycerol-3-phosphate dehydrogenase [Patulibacter defluvii]|uniref:NAD(P)H-dependent glycerol-3-phosphate dehydrogenase n=1 Tax=Patulibacter defluvii TaxID=3095358 RepID=UPI002A761019|nr:NAD(P)H-dependent glycerol-3-phosphate dehydrogenase [Patulibacter sp. DM4]
MTRPPAIGVLGAGSWGTTVASIAAANAPTTLWARDPAQADEIDREHRNRRYLGDRALHPRLRASGDLEAVVAASDVLVLAVPSRALRETAVAAAAHLRPWVPLVSLVKGLEVGTRLRPSEVLGQELPQHPVAVLSGPNLAREVLDGMAAASVVATADDHVARALQRLFRADLFRVYRNADVIGSELGGILKNVVAIATGMADGLGVGDNTRAMVITRGLAEMTRLGVALGAEAATFAGLTGMGDLIATCTSPLSRNRRVGVALGEGRAVAEIVAEMDQVAEGLVTVRPVVELAARHGVDVPIAAEVDAVVNAGRRPAEAYRGLRRIAPESEGHAVA